MEGLKKFGLVISIVLFGPLFLLSVFSFSFNRTLGSEDYTKSTVEEAGFYDAVGDTITTEAVGGDTETSPLITQSLESATSGDNIKVVLEPMLDSTYAWLRGDVQQPEFKLEIEPIKTEFEQNLTVALEARAASLPACTSFGQLTGDDIFTYSCIPPGTDVDTVINASVSRISNNASAFTDEVVDDGNINTEEAQELGINDPTQNLPESLPQTYQFLQGGQWWFVVGSLLTGAGIVLLSRNWLFGTRKLSILLVVNGVGVLAVGLVLGYVVSSLVPTTSVGTTEAAVNTLEEAVKVILNDNAGFLKAVGIVTTILGAMGIAASTVALNKKGPEDKAPQAPPTTDQTANKQ